jgi:DNA repair photolyase
MLAGNTDCYQPAERKFKITRQCLEVFMDLKHPFGIITKNSLIERDIDLLAELAKLRLVRVTLSLTTLNEAIKRVMEPRTSSVRSVLRTIRALTDAGVPVNVNAAPIIPAINDEGIFDLVKAAADAGATSVMHIVVRLNGHNANLFTDWVTKNFPDRANKVLNQIKTMHGGNLNDSNYGRRMRGEGKFAELIRNQMVLAKSLHLKGREFPPTNYDLFAQRKEEILNPIQQLKLF